MDLKEMYCERADEIAWDIYNKDFYDLTQIQQDQVWSMAESDVVEDCYNKADMMRKEC